MKTTTMLLAAVAMLGSTIATVHAADSAVPKSYPLKKCVVSDEALGEHGKSVKVTTPDGTDVYLCCKDCVKDFKKDPAKYGKMVKDAEGKK
jgi:YHS domain-containing protein